MYIMTNSERQIVNSDFVERFLISEKDDAALIVASYNDVRPPVTVGRYKDVKEAKRVLGELVRALAGGQMCFDMPESLLHFEEHIKKDARTRRKGGS